MARFLKPFPVLEGTSKDELGCTSSIIVESRDAYVLHSLRPSFHVADIGTGSLLLSESVFPAQ